LCVEGGVEGRKGKGARDGVLCDQSAWSQLSTHSGWLGGGYPVSRGTRPTRAATTESRKVLVRAMRGRRSALRTGGREARRMEERERGRGGVSCW
jgi:hypothetical protein